MRSVYLWISASSEGFSLSLLFNFLRGNCPVNGCFHGVNRVHMTNAHLCSVRFSSYSVTSVTRSTLP